MLHEVHGIAYIMAFYSAMAYTKRNFYTKHILLR